MTPETHFLDDGRDNGNVKARAEEFVNECV